MMSQGVTFISADLEGLFQLFGLSHCVLPVVEGGIPRVHEEG